MARPQDRLILASHNWSALWHLLTVEPPAVQGLTFERLTQLYLQSQPEYRAKLRHVWLLEEVPPLVSTRLHLPRADVGIDLVAETHGGEFWAIQCKFRSDTTSALTYRELSTFTSLAFVTCKGIDLAIVAHTSSKPVRKRSLLGNTTEIGLDRWLSLAPDEWKAIQSLIAGQTIRLEARSPKPHQQAALDAAISHFKTASRGRLIMPCGTGKSLTAFWIAKALDSRLTLVAVPSLALIRQSLQDWTREFLAAGEVPDWLAVCSDESTGNLDHDEFVGETYDLGIPTTTDRTEIAAFLRRRSDRRIVFTTYQSSDALADGAKAAGAAFDLAVLDEAHKTVGPKSKRFSTLLSENRIRIARRLFMTATERVVSTDSDDVLSMDNEHVYGSRFHLLTFKEAIRLRVISDYRIVTVAVHDSTVRQLLEDRRLLEVADEEIPAAEVAAAYALTETFAQRGVTHAISFHRSIKAAARFSALSASLPPRCTTDIGYFHVSSRLSAGERAQRIREFVGAPRALITNARCLTEGVDVPAIDCVMFADPKQSVVDTVQAAGRALRVYSAKEYGYILLPVVVPEGQDLESFADSSGFRQVVRTIMALSTQDERIAEQFRLIDRAKNRSGEIVEIEVDTAVGRAVDLAAFAAGIATKIWQRVGRANWLPFDDARKVVQSVRPHLRTRREWAKKFQAGIVPPGIPSNPHIVYADQGWTGWGDWLGTGYVSKTCRSYRTFEEARAFVHTLGLLNWADWRKYAVSSAKPSDIPASPDSVYAEEGYIDIADWLGHCSRGRGRFLDFAEARGIVRSMGLNSSTEWSMACVTGLLPNRIPKDPQRVYRQEGWAGFPDWLGTDQRRTKNRKWRDFEVARSWVQAQHLDSVEQWNQLLRSGNVPIEIPAFPGNVYRGKGWQGMSDWLGRDIGRYGKQRKMLPFSDARAIARRLCLKSVGEWHRACETGQVPENVPVTPDRVYRRTGWLDWSDWLGVPAKSRPRTQFLAYEQARAVVRKLGLAGYREWSAYSKSGSRTPSIPSNPHTVYLDKGWTSYSDWLGTTAIAPTKRKFRPFSEARQYARSLSLRSSADWLRFVREARPHDLPVYPQHVYKDDGWSGWGDWLGTGRQWSRR